MSRRGIKNQVQPRAKHKQKSYWACVGWIAVGEVDDGSIIGTKTIRQIHLSNDNRVINNLESLSWQDTYCHTVLNNTKYQSTSTGQAVSVGSGFLNLNTKTFNEMMVSLQYNVDYLNEEFKKQLEEQEI